MWGYISFIILLFFLKHFSVNIFIVRGGGLGRPGVPKFSNFPPHLLNLVLFPPPLFQCPEFPKLSIKHFPLINVPSKTPDIAFSQ